MPPSQNATRSITFALRNVEPETFRAIARTHVTLNFMAETYLRELRDLKFRRHSALVPLKNEAIFDAGQDLYEMLTGAARSEVKKTRDEIQKALDEATEPDEIARLKRALKEAATSVSGEIRNTARNFYRPLTSAYSSGSGKRKVPGAMNFRKLFLENPTEAIRSKAAYKALYPVTHGRGASWFVKDPTSESGYKIRPGLEGKTVAEWPKIQRKAILKKLDKNLPGGEDTPIQVISEYVDPLLPCSTLFGIDTELGHEAFGAAAKVLAPNETNKVAREEENEERANKAAEIDAKLSEDYHWHLVQELENELSIMFDEATPNRMGKKAKVEYRLDRRAVKGCDKIFSALREKLYSDQGATKEALVEVVKESQKKNDNIGSTLIFFRLCEEKYWPLWDAKEAKPVDRDLPRYNWVLKRAAFNEDTTPYRIPRLTHINPFIHPVWLNLGADGTWAVKSITLGRDPKATLEFLSSSFTRTAFEVSMKPNHRVRTDDEGNVFLVMGSSSVKDEDVAPHRRFGIDLKGTRVSIRRKDLEAIYRKLPKEMRERMNSLKANLMDKTFIEDVVNKVCEIEATRKTKSHVDLMIALEIKKRNDRLPDSFRDYYNEAGKKKPNDIKLRRLAKDLDGWVIKGFDSGVRNSGGVAFVRLTISDLPKGKPYKELPGGLKAYVERSATLTLPGDPAPGKDALTNEFLGLRNRISLGRTLLHLQSLVVHAFERDREKDEALKSCRKFFEEVEKEGLNLDPKDIGTDFEEAFARTKEAAKGDDLLILAQAFEQANRKLLKHVRRYRRDKWNEKREAWEKNSDVKPNMGGVTTARIEILRDLKAYEVAYAQRAFFSERGIFVPARYRRIHDMPMIARLDEQIANLQLDRARKQAAQVHNEPGKFDLFAYEDLQSYERNAKFNKRHNRRLTAWCHRRIEERHKAISEILGIPTRGVRAWATSKYDAITGSPGIRVGRYAPWLEKQSWWKDGLAKRYPIFRGSKTIPIRGGEFFATLHRGDLNIVPADENAAKHIALRAITPRKDDVYLRARRIEGEKIVIEEGDAIGRVLEVISTEGGVDRYAISKEKIDETSDGKEVFDKISGGKEVVFYRDPSGEFFDPEHWIRTDAFWSAVEEKITAALADQLQSAAE